MNTQNATYIAFLVVSVQQAVLAFGWLVGALLLPAHVRRAAAYWAGHAAAGSVAVVLFSHVALSGGGEPMLTTADLLMMASLIALHRGLWHFMRRPVPWRAHGALMGVALLTGVLAIGPAPSRVALMSALLCAQALWITIDVFRHARLYLSWRAGAWLLGLPLLAVAAVLLLRALQAGSVGDAAAFGTSDDGLFRVASAVFHEVLTLVFHMGLMGLVVSQLNSDLRRASRHDALTGLLNRSAIDVALADEVQRARRLQQPFSVLMIDADHFKALNDQHGHAAGDRALQHLATLMSAQMRDIDRFGRWGGEEFVAVLPASEMAEAMVLAERLRERVAALPLHASGSVMAMTVSVGVAQWRGETETAAEVLQRADAAMYRAKAAGRNRVEG